MAVYKINDSTLTAIANSIRTKGGASESLSASQMSDAILNIPVTSTSGGTVTTDATATAGDIFNGKTAYIAEGKVTGSYNAVFGQKNSSSAGWSTDTFTIDCPFRPDYVVLAANTANIANGKISSAWCAIAQNTATPYLVYTYQNDSASSKFTNVTIANPVDTGNVVWNEETKQVSIVLNSGAQFNPNATRFFCFK